MSALALFDFGVPVLGLGSALMLVLICAAAALLLGWGYGVSTGFDDGWEAATDYQEWKATVGVLSVDEAAIQWQLTASGAALAEAVATEWETRWQQEQAAAQAEWEAHYGFSQLSTLTPQPL